MGYIPDAVTQPVFQLYTEEDPVLVQLAQDVLKGKLRTELTKYKQVFKKLSYVDKVLLKGEKLIIPIKFHSH